MKSKKVISLPPVAIAKLVHEVNNHLATLSLSAELLKMELLPKLTKKQVSYLDNLLSEGKQIQKIVAKISAQTKR